MCAEVEGQSSRVDQCVPRWKGSYLVEWISVCRGGFGRVEIMNEERKAKKVMISYVEGNRCRGRPRLRWMDGVRMALEEKGMSVEQARRNALNRRRVELIVRSE